MHKFDESKWAYLTKKYPERAGVAWEMYLRDKNKKTNITTYFNFAGKRIREIEKRNRNGFNKWASKNQPTLETDI